MKQGLANISKYREEDSKKSEAMQVQIEENRKSTQDKISALEKFIMGVKEATERAATQTKPQSQFEASLNLMEDVRTLVSRTDSITYKMDALNYDMNLMKSDIIRQQRTTQGYFEKVDRLEKKVDSLHLGPGAGLGKSVAMNNTSGANFMANSSRTVDEPHFHRLLQQDVYSKDGSASTHDNGHYSAPYPAPMSQMIPQQVHKEQPRNYFMEEELDKEFGKDHFGGNLSIIDKGGKLS